jgi:hypothetical protein
MEAFYETGFKKAAFLPAFSDTGYRRADTGVRKIARAYSHRAIVNNSLSL